MTGKRKTVSLRMAFSMSSCSNVKPLYEGFIVEINGRDWTINTMMFGEIALRCWPVMSLKSKDTLDSLGSIVLIIAHNACFDGASWSDGFPPQPRILGMPSLAVETVTYHTPSQRSWLRSKGLSGYPKLILPMPDMGNDLIVDAGRVGDFGKAFDIAPKGRSGDC